MMKDNSPNDLVPLTDVWTLITAFTDAMNLRHLQGELYGESLDLVRQPQSDLQRSREPVVCDDVGERARPRR